MRSLSAGRGKVQVHHAWNRKNLAAFRKELKLNMAVAYHKVRRVEWSHLRRLRDPRVDVVRWSFP